MLLCCQVGLILYHQITTLFDFYPFNGARNYTGKEKMAEAGSNFVLMSLAPIGFSFQIRGLMIFGIVYYFFLFAVEIIIWWIPYKRHRRAAGGIFTTACLRIRLHVSRKEIP